MKILAQFTGKVLKFNPTGLSRVQLTDLSNNNTCETDSTSAELKKVGVDFDGCDFEILITEENGHPKGVIKKVSPEPVPPAEIELSPEAVQQSSDFNI
jgi:hypothetical protein